MKLPKQLTIGCYTFDVVVDNKRMADKNAYGYFEPSTNTITLATKADGSKLKKEIVWHTFYHELTHAILRQMGSDMYKDETFVDLFANLLYQSLKTMK